MPRKLNRIASLFACRSKSIDGCNKENIAKTSSIKKLARFGFNTHHRQSKDNSVDSSSSVNETVGNHLNGVIRNSDRDGSIKETLSLSTTSQTAGFGDGASASIGGWSTLQHFDTYSDASKINLIASEDSFCIPRINGISRSSLPVEEVCDRIESLVLRLEKLAGISPLSTTSQQVEAFRTLIDSQLQAYIDISRELGGELRRQALLVKESFEKVEQLVRLSTVHCQPLRHDMESYLQSIACKMQEVMDFDPTDTEVGRSLVRLISDSIVVLAWCDCKHSTDYIKDIIDSANCNANKIFQYCNPGLPRQAELVRRWLACLQSVGDFVVLYYPNGLTWNQLGSPPPRPPKPQPPVRHASTKSTESATHGNGSLPGGPKRQFKLPVSGQFDRDRLMKDLSSSRSHRELRHVKSPSDRLL